MIPPRGRCEVSKQIYPPLALDFVLQPVLSAAPAQCDAATREDPCVRQSKNGEVTLVRTVGRHIVECNKIRIVRLGLLL